jgi:SAM-dependent methyltransferase
MICSKCEEVLPVDGCNVFVGSSDRLTDDWREKQEGSVSRYSSKDYNRDETVPLLFGGFMAPTLDRQEVVLDIGCGIMPGLPAYVRELRLENYVGIEPLPYPLQREFPCLVGAIAESLPFDDASVDAMILATSIDHIEDINAAVSEMLRVLKANGRLYIWVGLCEPRAMARAKSFYNIAFGGSLFRRVARSVLLPFDYGWLLLRMADRQRRLNRGIPIDNAHCHYFTESRLQEDLSSWGLVAARELVVPGTHSKFVEARRLRRN